jgi:hypothetical protein
MPPRAHAYWPTKSHLIKFPEPSKIVSPTRELSIQDISLGDISDSNHNTHFISLVDTKAPGGCE